MKLPSRKALLSLSVMILLAFGSGYTFNFVFAGSPTSPSGSPGSSLDQGAGTGCSASFCIGTQNLSSVQTYFAQIGTGYSVPSTGCALTAGCLVGTIAFGTYYSSTGALIASNQGGATGTNAQAVSQDAVNALTSGRTYYQTVAFEGQFTWATASSFLVPSWTHLDFTDANITMQGVAGIVNAGFANTYNTNSHIWITGGTFTATGAAQWINLLGATDVTLDHQTLIPPTGSGCDGAETLLVGADQNIFINHLSVFGQSTLRNCWSYGIFSGPTTGSTLINRNVTVAYPYLYGISANSLYLTGQNVHVIQPTIIAVGNSANSNTTDSLIDIESNGNIGSISTGIVIDQPHLSVIPNSHTVLYNGIFIDSTFDQKATSDITINQPTINTSSSANGGATAMMTIDTGITSLTINGGYFVGGATIGGLGAISFNLENDSSHITFNDPTFINLKENAFGFGSTQIGATKPTWTVSINNPTFINLNSTSYAVNFATSPALNGYFSMTGGSWDKTGAGFIGGTNPYGAGNLSLRSIAGYDFPNNVAFGNLGTSIKMASNSALSTGFGVNIVSKDGSNQILVQACGDVSANTTQNILFAIYRTTGSIPALNASATGSQIAVSTFASPAANSIVQICVMYMDSGLTLGTSYNYYLAYSVSQGAKSSITLYSTVSNSATGTTIFAQEQ